MKKLTTVLLVLLALILPTFTWLPGYGNPGEQKKVVEQVENVSSFEQAVEIIKKYEGLHSPKHWPLIGYGHQVMPGEKYSRSRALSEKEAEALLRKDLLKNCAVFREFGKDSLLLGVLAYNIGSGATLKSSVVKKLKSGSRDIKESYIAHCKYRGKVLSGLKKRRIEEFEALFEEETKTGRMKIDQIRDAEESEMMASSEKKVDGTSGSDGKALFTSVFSPVRLMLGALSNPFRMATLDSTDSTLASTNIDTSLTNSLCRPSI